MDPCWSVKVPNWSIRIAWIRRGAELAGCGAGSGAGVLATSLAARGHGAGATDPPFEMSRTVRRRVMDPCWSVKVPNWSIRIAWIRRGAELAAVLGQDQEQVCWRRL
jgi:hypothetical protein